MSASYPTAGSDAFSIEILHLVEPRSRTEFVKRSKVINPLISCLFFETVKPLVVR